MWDDTKLIEIVQGIFSLNNTVFSFSNADLMSLKSALFKEYYEKSLEVRGFG